LVHERINVVDSGMADLPNVVVDEESPGIGICASSEWGRLGDLASLFVGILSHESIHLTLLKIDGDSSDYLDNVASLSAVSRSLSGIGLVRKYTNGMIGLDQKIGEGDLS
jgi:hypothetical protein